MFIEGLFFQLFLSDSSLDTWSTEHERMVPSVWIIWLHQPFWTATHVKCGGKRRLFTEVWTWYQCLAWPMMSRLFLNRLICMICSLPLISPLLHRNPPWLADNRKVPFAQIFCTESKACVCTGTHTDKVKEECIGAEMQKAVSTASMLVLFSPQLCNFFWGCICVQIFHPC